MNRVGRASLIALMLMCGAFGNRVQGQATVDALIPPPPEPTFSPPPAPAQRVNIEPTSPPPSPAWNLAPVSVEDDSQVSGEMPKRRGWYARGEVMFLQISPSSHQPLAYNLSDVGGPALVQSGPVLSTDSLSNRQFGALPRITIGFQQNDRSAYELTYFGRNDWSGDGVANSHPRSTPPIVFLRTPDTLAVDSVAASLATALQSVELNAIERLPTTTDFRFLAGFRYIGFYERFLFQAERFSTPNRIGSEYEIDSANNLFGAQVGLNWSHHWQQWSLSAVGKTGVYANQIWQDQFLGYWRRGGGFAAHDLTMTRPNAAFVQEFGANAEFRATAWCTIRAGYNLFIISDIARAGEQIDFSLNAMPALDQHGTAVLHGPNAGVEIRF